MKKFVRFPSGKGSFVKLTFKMVKVASTCIFQTDFAIAQHHVVSVACTQHPAMQYQEQAAKCEMKYKMQSHKSNNTRGFRAIRFLSIKKIICFHCS